MRNKDYSIDDTFKIVWAYMPLSLEEMSKIEVSHQVRPYLLCMEKEDYFYAFPCTSKVFTNKFRYQNGKVILNDVVDYKKRREVKNELFTRILKDIDNTNGVIQFASTTIEIKNDTNIDPYRY